MDRKETWQIIVYTKRGTIISTAVNYNPLNGAGHDFMYQYTHNEKDREETVKIEIIKVY